MKRIVKNIGVTLVALLGATGLRAQTVPVAGTVYNEENQPMAGVTVIIQKTNKGVVSDAKGQFRIEAQKGQHVEFSFIGYKNRVMEVKDRMTGLSVKLEPDVNKIDEVLVTVGYGQVAKKDLSGAVATVQLSDLEKTMSANLSDALAGRMSGVQVTSSEGGPGAGVDITIRGGNSLTGSNAPLWVIDGFPVDDPNTFSIDSKDIEQMQVLKDASATAIYGARGANGVIIIETKKGTSGNKVNVEYNGSFSISSLPKSRQIEMVQGLDFLRLSRAIAAQNSSDGSTTNFDDRYLVNDLYKRVSPGGEYMLDGSGNRIPLTYANAADWEKLTIEDYANYPSYMHNWQDEAFETAYTHSHRVAVNGGNDQTRYSVSMNAFLQDGILLKTGIDKYNIRASLDQKLSKKIKFTALVNYNATRRHGLQSSEGARNSVIRDILQYQPVNPIKYGDLGSGDVPTDVDSDENNLTYPPIRNINNAYRETYIDQLTFNGSLNYQIIKNLRFMARGGYTHYTVLADVFNNANSRYGHPILSANGINASKANTVRDTWFNEYTLTYNKKWGKNRFDAMGGYTMEGYKNRYIFNQWIKFPTDILGMNDMSQGTPVPPQNSLEEWFSMSFLGRINYVYDDKYILTASFRADGSSKFLGDNRFGYFPSGAVAWRMSQEPWLRDVAWLSNLKLRGSWGMTGNNRIGASSVYGALSSSNATGYPFDNDYVTGYLPSRVANPLLKWETTRQTDVGVDFAVLNNRISLTVDWYHKVTKDLLLNTDLPNSSGYSKAQKNVGSVQNTGWEFSLNTTNIDRKHFTWTSSFNISFNRNKVLALNSGQRYMLTNPNWYHQYTQDQYIAEIGMPASMMYGYVFDGIYQTSDFYYVDGKYIVKEGLPSLVGASAPMPGSIKYKDLDGDGTIDANDMTVIGDPNPKHYGGFTNNFRLYNFDLSVFFTWSYGNDILNANDVYFTTFENYRNNYLAKSLNYWSPTNPSNSMSAPKSFDKWVSSRSVEDGSYLRLSNVTLGYNLDARKVKFLKKLGLTAIRVYAAADNLFVITDYSGYDPEVNTNSSALTRGLDYCSYPRARTFTFGLDLKF